MIELSSSPSSASSAQRLTLSDTNASDLLDCGHRSKDRFWRSVRFKGQPVATIERICPSCANESSEDTTGATGRRASDAANRETGRQSLIDSLALVASTNSSDRPGEEPSIEPRLLDGRAQSSLPEPFKTLLHGVFSNATDWVRGVLRSVAGSERPPELSDHTKMQAEH